MKYHYLLYFSYILILDYAKHMLDIKLLYISLSIFCNLRNLLSTLLLLLMVIIYILNYLRAQHFV